MNPGRSRGARVVPTNLRHHLPTGLDCPRASVLCGVATEFADSEGGRNPGRQASEEFEQASPQRIRITRGCLLDNLMVAGEMGLATA